MGRCRYCQQSAGFFSSEHANCSKAAEAARSDLQSMQRELVRGEITIEQFAMTGERITANSRLPESDADKILCASLDGFVREFALYQPLSELTLDRILGLYEKFHPEWRTLGPEQKAQLPGYLTLLHSGTLYDVLHGTVPTKRHPSMASGFRLDADESPIVRRNTTLAQNRPSNGSSFQSISVPVGLGLYYRFGISQSNVGQVRLTQVDQGLMLLTTKAIYFSGNSTTFRIDYASILRLALCENGFEVHGSFGDGKVFLPFRIGTIEENWYFYNIVAALTDVG